MARPFRPRRSGAQAEEAAARKALDRTTGMLRAYQRSGLTVVAIEDVLTLLGAVPDAPASAGQAPRDPQADPLTGCLPVTPQGARSG